MNSSTNFNYTDGLPIPYGNVGSYPMLLNQMIQILNIGLSGLMADYVADYNSGIKDGQEFDFIVVGGGSAGSIIANRLSELANFNVLLIEAGQDPPIESKVPALWTKIMGTEYDWGDVTEKAESVCLGMRDNRCVWPAGKMIGGGGSMNIMYCVRGSPRDYNRWANKLGNKGWSYKEILKYFIKLEQIDGTRVERPKKHGYEGPIHIIDGRRERDMSRDGKLVFRSLMNALRDVGLDYVHDCVSRVVNCYTNSLINLNDGVRSSSANEYLTGNVKNRSNLRVLKGARVTKVLLEENKVKRAAESHKAYGVEVFVNGKFLKLKATKEVVLSAGAVGTPQILMYSGIGPQEHLRDFNINVVKDLKVGYNLQDHIFVSNYYTQLNIPISNTMNEKEDAMYTYQYITERMGPLANPAIPVLLFSNSKNKTNENNLPDTQILFVDLPPGSGFTETLRTGFHIKDEILEIVEKSLVSHRTLFAFIVLLKPKSRGRIMLRDSNPLSRPKIRHGYLTREKDVKVLANGMRLAKKIFNNINGSQPFIIPLPKCDSLPRDSDRYLECYMRHFGTTLFHPTGTCKMGPATDPDAVVSPVLKVHGVSGLRVADASVMPIIPRGNTNIPTMMIAEKASDMIKEEWNCCAC